MYSMNNNITFGARFIQKIPINTYCFEKKIYTPDTANFVEFMPADSKDICVLGDIAQDFGGDSFANNVYIHAKYFRNNEASRARFFGLTKQNSDYENLNPNKVLGVCEITKKSEHTNEIEYLQVHPRFVYPCGPRPIKRIGTAILDCIKEFSNKITLRASYNSGKFYKKNDFTEINPEKRLYLWTKEN